MLHARIAVATLLLAFRMFFVVLGCVLVRLLCLSLVMLVGAVVQARFALVPSSCCSTPINNG